MPIVTCCCGANLKVPAEMIGEMDKCPKCGKLVGLTKGSVKMNPREGE